MKKNLFDRESAPSETIPCPIHGEPLEVREQDGKVIGVCQCKVPNNAWAEKTVYERAATTKE